MRNVTNSLLFALSLLLFAQRYATATVLLSPPPPDAQLSFELSATELNALTDVLLKFGKSEALLPYRNAPRASGKLFFLGLRRDDTILIITEKPAVGSRIIVDCYDVNESVTPYKFQQVVSRLVSTLRKKWPELRITSVEQKGEPSRHLWRN